MHPRRGLTVTLTKKERSERPADRGHLGKVWIPTPIIRAEVLEGTHVGYIVYDSFDAAYDNDLLAAIKSLKEAGITDLVLDLRNNGGGHVITSNMLSTCIGGSACQDRVYQYYRYNDERMADWKQTSETFGMSYDQTAQLFFENFYYSNYFGVSLANYALNLSRLYVLVSDGTASASEAVINSLKGIGLPVTLIGSKTNGKNVGMNVFTWSNIEGYDYEFAPDLVPGLQRPEADGRSGGHHSRLRGQRHGFGRMVRGFRPRRAARAQGPRTDRRSRRIIGNDPQRGNPSARFSAEASGRPSNGRTA